MRNQKGITLIALVITIIVLLILAGVAIAMLTGESGLLNQAENAKKETVEAEARERIDLALAAIKAASYTKLADDNNWVAVSGETPALDPDFKVSIELDGFTKDAETGYAYTYDEETITLSYTDAEFNFTVSGTYTVEDNSTSKADLVKAEAEG